MSAIRDCDVHGEWVDDGTTEVCPECWAEGAAKQLAWMDYMDRLAQEELGARPRGEVIVDVPATPRPIEDSQEDTRDA